MGVRLSYINQGLREYLEHVIAQAIFRHYPTFDSDSGCRYNACIASRHRGIYELIDCDYEGYTVEIIGAWQPTRRARDPHRGDSIGGHPHKFLLVPPLDFSHLV